MAEPALSDTNANSADLYFLKQVSVWGTFREGEKKLAKHSGASGKSANCS